MLLVERGHASSAAEFDHLILNNAERRTLGYACLRRLGKRPDDFDARDLLIRIYRAVRDPQRRNLETTATDMAIEIDWPEVEPNP